MSLRRCGIAAALATAVVVLASCRTSTSDAELSVASSNHAPPGAASRDGGRRFTFAAHRLSPRLRRRITGVSWHKGCPVGRARLRYLRIAYHGFDGRVHSGEMIANRSAVRPLRRAFAGLYRGHFKIRR